MLSRIKGKVVSVIDKEAIEVAVSGLTYKVYMSPVSLSLIELYQDVEVFTYYYFQNDLGRAIPVLIGFLNPIEREFFELFITVSGIGPKAAIKSFTLPVSKIAEAIYTADAKSLCSLPGIGKQRAKQIIARLQEKVAKFALLRQEPTPKGQETHKDDTIFEEAYEVLLQLQYKKSEAKEMIEKVKRMNKVYSSVEDLLSDIYKSK